jgi:hypothetical protein
MVYVSCVAWALLCVSLPVLTVWVVLAINVLTETRDRRR